MDSQGATLTANQDIVIVPSLTEYKGLIAGI